jgi:hypothetical protein
VAQQRRARVGSASDVVGNIIHTPGLPRRFRRNLVARAGLGKGPESTCAVTRRRFPDPMGRQTRFR